MLFYPWLPILVTAYLLGAIPSAYILGRLLRGVDIREVGDGNPGAANAFRELGSGVGIAVGILDIGKGAGAVLMAQTVGATDSTILLAGVSSVAGHNWPVFLHSRGGRGAATALGVLLVTIPLATIPLTLLGSILLLLTRNTTVMFIFTYTPLAVLTWYLGEPVQLVAYAVALPVLVGVGHFVSLHRAPVERRASFPDGEG